MKNFKKISLGFLPLVVFFGFYSVRSQAAAAYTPVTKTEITDAATTFTFQDRATIVAHFKGGGTATFVDKTPQDFTYQYAVQDSSCHGIIDFGNSDEIAWGNPRDVKDFKAKADIDYKPGLSQSCQNVGKSGSTIDITVSDPNSTLYTYFNWGISNTMDAIAPAKISNGPLVPMTFNGTDVNGYFQENTTNSCPDVLVLNGTNKATFYNQTNGSGYSSGSLSDLSQYFSNCHVEAINFSNTSDVHDTTNFSQQWQELAGKSFNVGGQPPSNVCSNISCRNTAGSTAPGTGGGTAATAEDSCNFNSHTAFTWIICPALIIAQDGANGLTKLFENQLSFTVSDLGPGVHGGAAKVQTAWSTIRIISSILLVIVMLIMVISQATSWGSIDAYTVRKMLPRLVVAVILIQVSWDLFGYVILVVNAIGTGLADLMYYPFGGSSNMDIGSLLANANIGNGQISSYGWFVGGLGAFAIAGVLGVAAAPAVLGFAVAAFFALATGLVTLMFRKILIIGCLIFSPLALLAWILPGTQKYWKLWWDNFSKALMMFPIVVAIVASGRIFAYISGTQNTGLGISVLLNFIIVMVGFFGPLFILPKTFKWGGSLMNTAGSTITNAVKPLSDNATKGARGIGERWQGQGGKAYNPNAKWYARGARRIQSGHIMPAGIPGLKGAAERSRRLTIASGEKWASERNDEAEALVARTGEKARTGYGRIIRDRNTGEYVNVAKDNDGNMINAAGNVVTDWHDAQELYRGTDRTQAGMENLTGVEAEKQAFLDMLSNDDTDPQRRAAQAAHKKLIDTHSEIELQNSSIQGGKYDGKRAFEVPTFDATLQSSPQHYGAINNSRPDFAPDVKQSAEANVSRSLGRTVEYKTADAADTALLNRERLRIAIDRLTPEAVQNAHYGFYDEIANTGDASLAADLRTRLVDFRDNAGTLGRNAVGSLKGGKESHVNAALGLLGPALLPPGFIGPAPGPPTLDSM
jgi:hypothetical protein